MAKSQEGLVGSVFKIAGELLLVPGISLLAEGKVKKGIFHTGAGLLAKAALGFPGLAVVAANSYSESTTGRSLISHFLSDEEGTVGEDSLRELVENDLARGFTLEEIYERLSEDIEDLYAEALTKMNGN